MALRGWPPAERRMERKRPHFGQFSNDAFPVARKASTGFLATVTRIGPVAFVQWLFGLLITLSPRTFRVLAATSIKCTTQRNDVSKSERPDVTVSDREHISSVELPIDDITCVPEDLHRSLLWAAARARHGRHRLAKGSARLVLNN